MTDAGPHDEALDVAIVGLGAIGSTLAHRLSRAGHRVTAIARGDRLRRLERDRAIVTIEGSSAPIEPREALDPAHAHDLVLVTVLAHQLAPLLPSLRASAARHVVFAFNTVAPLSTLADAVGPERFGFVFPGVVASLEDGLLRAQIVSIGQRTLATHARWAALLTRAGIPTDVEPRMQAWLRAHAVIISVVLSMGSRAHAQGRGLDWSEARAHALALRAGLTFVRRLGEPPTPRFVALLPRLPPSLVATILFLASRTALVRRVGAAGPSEPRALVDALATLGPDDATELTALRAIRP
ncbi:MAG: 2-dehydropantoate 2-reductase N-terminal domain-containing protein [Sandaracinus sp.]